VAACCTGDPTIARDAIVGAAEYLVDGGGPADMNAALHHYNPNDGYVTTVTAFAENMRDNPQLYNAYREWQVFYSTSARHQSVFRPDTRSRSRSTRRRTSPTILRTPQAEYRWPVADLIDISTRIIDSALSTRWSTGSPTS
jgi:hypothetical protein